MLLAAGALLGWPAQPAYAQLARETITPAAARAITKEAYSYGFPLVDNDRGEGEDGATGKSVKGLRPFGGQTPDVLDAVDIY